MIDEREKTFADYLGILRRRWRGATAVFVVLLFVSAGVALLWPATYRSTATILIEQQEIPQDLVRSTITSFADQRIELISQRVMTTANLLEIIRDHELYADDFDSEPREVIIERMRNDISRNMISAEVVDPRSGRPTEATIAFTVGFDSQSPRQAQLVANELTSLYLQENSQTRREQAAEASSFLADEATRLSEEIAILESSLADFKQENVNRLPELAQLNMQLFERTERDLEELQRQRSVLEERKIYLESELAQLNPTRDYVGEDGNLILAPRERLKVLQAQLSSLRGVYSDRHPTVVRVRRSLAALEEELGVAAEADVSELATELDRLTTLRGELLDRYSESHPDVVRVDRQIAATRATLEDGNPVTVPITEPSLTDVDADNPVYVQLRAQLSATEMEIAALGVRGDGLQARLSDFEQRLAQTPVIERDYYALTRDLDTARLRYQEIRFGERSAQTAENLEIDAKGERFTLIEPALTPQQPIAPNRAIIMFLGMILAGAAAVGLIALREVIDASVHSPIDVQYITRLAPLGIIPVIVTREDRQRVTRRRIIAAAGAAVTALLLVGLLHFFVMPVDDFWFRALRRVGI